MIYFGKMGTVVPNTIPRVFGYIPNTVGMVFGNAAPKRTPKHHPQGIWDQPIHRIPNMPKDGV